MSFRLRIFLLVLVVAGTAIGATAWLTLSLASREVTQLDATRAEQEAEVYEQVHRFGVLHGRWNGLDELVGDLSGRTGLHILVQTGEEVLVDSDNLKDRASGPVRSVSSSVQPYPELDRGIWDAASLMAKRDGTVEGRARVAVAAPRFTLPANLFAVDVTDADLAIRTMVQLAQYRVALVAVRCAAGQAPWPQAVLSSDKAPFLSADFLAGQGECVKTGVRKVLGDIEWQRTWWDALSDCRYATGRYYSGCLARVFAEGASSTGAVPVEIFFGVQQETDLGALRRPALFGAASLLVVAALGTAWIARRVSRPVRLLTGASLQLAAGRLDVRVPDGGPDELARLSASFNAMAEALQRSEERQRRLIADVAHEMRTPLSNLRGYLEGLADGVIEPSPELFASLHEETLLQRRILDDLQVLALAEAGELDYTPVPLDLADLAETAATAHRVVAAAAGVDLVVDAPEPVRIEADPDRTRQVLGNLLSNAIRYTDAGGRVELRVGRDAQAAILTVRDTGVGMSTDEVARAFDRFWRADPARQRATGGSGLGLTIARRIVADQGGTLEAASTPGLGTTFTVRLPIGPADPAATLSGVFSRRARREIGGR